jgi:cell division septum initiation protein DivIVA
MSQGEKLFDRLEDMTSRPSFESALRGYDRRQVDQYVSQAATEISKLADDRELAFGQIQNLAVQLQRLQAELAELRQRPPQLDRASFRHLGPMVDQILALAEKQADAIINAAAQRAAEHQAEAEKVLAETHELAATLRADGEAAQERAEQEAKRIDEQSAQQVEHARAEAEAMVEAARVQVQQEVEAARVQTQQELAQWKANLEREIAERRTAAELELDRQRTAAKQKNAALQAEAQQYSADLRRRIDEQAAAHQQQLTVVQEEIGARQQALAQLQTAQETAEQRLAQSHQERATADREVAQLAQRLGEVRQDLTAQINRLDEARQAADSAERHAVEVRARVQREAKRVADRAAAAVMAAAAISAETGEYRMVALRSDTNRTAGEATEPAAGEVAPDPQTPTGANTGQPEAGPATHPEPRAVTESVAGHHGLSRG